MARRTIFIHSCGNSDIKWVIALMQGGSEPVGWWGILKSRGYHVMFFFFDEFIWLIDLTI